MLARWARVQWNRILRREFSVLRKPQATRLTCLTRRFIPSVRALVMPVSMNAKMAGHHASIVVARRVSSGSSASAHQV